MYRCDICKHQDSCVCIPYGCGEFEIDLSKHDAKIRADLIDCEMILDIIRDALLDYNFGSDSPKLGYKDGHLIYCSTNYDWFRIECDYEPKSILFSAICLILEDMFNLDWNKF